MGQTSRIFERGDVFTSRPELANAYAALERIDGVADLGAFSHSKADLLERMSVVRGSLASVHAAVDEISEAAFGVSLFDHEEGSSGARIDSAIDAIMVRADIDDAPPPSSAELGARLEEISVLASRLKRALKDFDEDANRREDDRKRRG